MTKVLSVPMQSEAVSRLSGGVLHQIDGTKSGRLCPIELTHIAASLAIERRERAGQSIGHGDLPQIGGTADLMPQIGGTCLTFDGNGQVRRPVNAARLPRARTRLKAWKQHRQGPPTGGLSV